MRYVGGRTRLGAIFRSPSPGNLMLASARGLYHIHHSEGNLVGHGDGDIEDRGKRQTPGGNHFFETFSVDQLHHQNILTLHLLDVVGGDNAGVIEGRNSPGFAPDALALEILGRFTMPIDVPLFWI